jgi:hypothetical protein
LKRAITRELDESAAPAVKRPRIRFELAARQVTMPRPGIRSRKRKSGEKGNASLPWQIPKLDAAKWAFEFCKAMWWLDEDEFDRYADCSPNLSEPQP